MIIVFIEAAVEILAMSFALACAGLIVLLGVAWCIDKVKEKKLGA